MWCSLLLSFSPFPSSLSSIASSVHLLRREFRLCHGTTSCHSYCLGLVCSFSRMLNLLIPFLFILRACKDMYLFCLSVTFNVLRFLFRASTLPSFPSAVGKYLNFLPDFSSHNLLKEVHWRVKVLHCWCWTNAGIFWPCSKAVSPSNTDTRGLFGSVWGEETLNFLDSVRRVRWKVEEVTFHKGKKTLLI